MVVKWRALDGISTIMSRNALRCYYQVALVEQITYTLLIHEGEFKHCEEFEVVDFTKTFISTDFAPYLHRHRCYVKIPPDSFPMVIVFRSVRVRHSSRARVIGRSNARKGTALYRGRTGQKQWN